VSLPINFNLPDWCDESEISPATECEESLYLDENEPREPDFNE
jgi:hypothetical protein